MKIIILAVSVLFWSSMGVSVLAATPSPEGAQVYIIAPSDGEVLWRYKSDAELTSIVEGNRLLYLESTRILPEMLSKFGGGSPPEISVVAVRKRGFLHRLTHW